MLGCHLKEKTQETDVANIKYKIIYFDLGVPLTSHAVGSGDGVETVSARIQLLPQQLNDTTAATRIQLLPQQLNDTTAATRIQLLPQQLDDSNATAATVITSEGLPG